MVGLRAYALMPTGFLTQETIAVLTGSELTPAELLKIDKTKLAEVVEEEQEGAAVVPSIQPPLRDETKAKLKELSDQVGTLEEKPAQAPVAAPSPIPSSDTPAEPTKATSDDAATVRSLHSRSRSPDATAADVVRMRYLRRPMQRPLIRRRQRRRRPLVVTCTTLCECSDRSRPAVHPCTSTRGA
jgi:hypothetical protein